MDQVQGLLEQIGLVRLAVIVGAIVLFVVVRKLLGSGRSTSGVTASARCACGWMGTASRHRPVCPRCGNTPFLG